MASLTLKASERKSLEKWYLVSCTMIAALILAIAVLTELSVQMHTSLVAITAIWIPIGAYFGYHTAMAVMCGWLPSVETFRPLEALIKHTLCCLIGPLGALMLRQEERSYY